MNENKCRLTDYVHLTKATIQKAANKVKITNMCFYFKPQNSKAYIINIADTCFEL